LKQYSLRKHSISVCILFAAALLPGSATAGILYDNLGNGNGNGTGVNATTWLANSFTTDGSADTITSLTLSLEGIAGGGNLTVDIDASTAGGPGSVLGSGTIPQSALSPTGFTDITGTGSLTLAPNTMYWIVLAGSSTTQNDALWERAKNSTGIGVAGEDIASSNNSGSTWVVRGVGGDFVPFVMELQDSTPTPEPGTLAVAFLGLAGIVAARHRRQRG
jgi:hypothetical protein